MNGAGNDGVGACSWLCMGWTCGSRKVDRARYGGSNGIHVLMATNIETHKQQQTVGNTPRRYPQVLKFGTAEKGKGTQPTGYEFRVQIRDARTLALALPLSAAGKVSFLGPSNISITCRRGQVGAPLALTGKRTAWTNHGRAWWGFN